MGRAIEITASDGHRLAAYQVGDPAAPRALVLCHDVGGLNNNVKRLSKQIAAFGFHVIAPALFDRAERDTSLGYQAADLARGAALGARVTQADQRTDITAAAGHLGHAKIGVIGFGWGGTAAWNAAGHIPAFGAAVAYYGTGIAEARQNIPLCPTQLHFGAYDRFISLADVDAIRRAQPSVQIEVYPTAGHLFACDESEAFEPNSVETARDNMLVFLRRHL